MGDARNFSKALRSATACAAAVYGFVVRPRISRWGATDAEVHRPLPGDELESPYGYRPVSTRAITIDAPPEEVQLLPTRLELCADGDTVLSTVRMKVPASMSCCAGCRAIAGRSSLDMTMVDGMLAMWFERW